MGSVKVSTDFLKVLIPKDCLAEEKFGVSAYKSVGEKMIPDKALSIYPNVLSSSTQKG